MKLIILLLTATLLSLFANAQWSTADASNNIHSTNSGNVGIGSATPTTGKLQIGDANNFNNYKLVIPGGYNFEKTKLGQYGNGASGLEFINHFNTTNSYGMRLLANVDQVLGLQFQYAPSVSAETSLSYSTGMFMNGNNGYIGIGTTNPGNKLQIADGADDAGAYGSVQIIRPTNPGDNRFHLSFIRNGQMVSGIGYVNGTNTLGIWAGTSTVSTQPLITFLQNQSVGIGTADTKGYLLAVAGSAIATKVVVKQQASWPDYVFDSSYDLKSLSNVEQFVKTNKHLQDVPSAEDIKKEGVDLGSTQAALLKKIEELTLYMIQQKKRIDQQETHLQTLENELHKVQNNKVAR